jgi:hypothetical protein
MEEFLSKILKTSFIEVLIYGMQNFFPWVLYALIKIFYKMFKKNELYSDFHDNGRGKAIISSISENKTKLDATHVLVTRIHNGLRWLNGDHMNKLSVFKSFTVFKKLFFTAELENEKLSELAEILISVKDKDFDIISVEELPRYHKYRSILKSDKIKYIALFKIQKSSKVLGYIFVLFQDGKVASYNREVYQDFLRIASEIAKEFS